MADWYCYELDNDRNAFMFPAYHLSYCKPPGGDDWINQKTLSFILATRDPKIFNQLAA